MLRSGGRALGAFYAVAPAFAKAKASKRFGYCSLPRRGQHRRDRALEMFNSIRMWGREGTG
jgi:hypothetical protein